MKMIMAIVQPKDSNRVRDALAKNKIGVTKLTTSGGFLHEGNTTFMIVVEDKRVDEALEIICLLYTSPSPRDKRQSRMPSSA